MMNFAYCNSLIIAKKEVTLQPTVFWTLIKDELSIRALKKLSGFNDDYSYCESIDLFKSVVVPKTYYCFSYFG